MDTEVLFADGSFVSMIIWQLPESSKERPYGYKYRLNYCTSDGITLVRYDNRHGKGDHKHILDEEMPIKYRGIEQLISDFSHDVMKMMEEKQYE